MLQDDKTLADGVYLMGRDHFHKLASLAIRMQGARELGVLAAHSTFGEDRLPEPYIVEKMAADWAKRSGIMKIKLPKSEEDIDPAGDLEVLSAVKTAADLEKLGAAAYAELGEEHMTKLASQILEGEVSWDELSELEKVAIGWMGKALGGLKKGVQFFTKGKSVSLPGPKTPGQGFGAKMREGWNVMTGKGRTPQMPSPGASKVQQYAQEAKALKAQPGGAKTMVGGSGGGPYRTPSTPGQPAPARPGRKWYQPSLKTQLGVGAALAGGTYLGGKALDVGHAFLTPQPPGTAYQYGGGAPSHFMNPQGGM